MLMAHALMLQAPLATLSAAGWWCARLPLMPKMNMLTRCTRSCFLGVLAWRLVAMLWLAAVVLNFL